MNQTNKDQGPEDVRDFGATHSAAPSSQDLSSLTYPTKEPKQEPLQSSARTSGEGTPSEADFSAHKTSPPSPDLNEYDAGAGVTLNPFDKLSDSTGDAFKNGDFVRGIANSAAMAGMLASTITCAGLEWLGLSQGFSAPSMMSGLVYGGAGLALASGVSMAITYGVWRTAHEYRRLTGQTTATWAEAIPANSLNADRMTPLPVWTACIKNFLTTLGDYLGSSKR